MIIGVTGTDGGGKGTVVGYLAKEKGFVWCSARTLWVDEIKKRGLEPVRANMRIVANDLRAKNGSDYLIEEYKRRTGFKSGEDYIIDSLRTTAEVETLKKYGGVLWAVDADPHIRYERIQARASESDKVTFEDFVSHEALEMNDPDPSGMQKAAVIEMATVHLTNNTTLDDLYVQVEEALKKPAHRAESSI